MILKLASVLKRILPFFLHNWLSNIYKIFYKVVFRIKLINVRKNHLKALEIVRTKEKIKVAFFLIHESVWKYEGVYKLLEKDERFEPMVIVCPDIINGEETMLRDMNQAYENFKKNGYNIIKTLNEKTGEWLDVRKEIKPDIIFFTNPHKLTKEEYYITNYLDCLTCYVQYSFHITHLHNLQYNQLFHNLIWKAFYETPMHYHFAQKYASNKGRNVIVSGYPGIDILMDKDHSPIDKWKIKDRKIKRIIWAPHHTIDDDKSFLSYSNFLDLDKIMIDIALTHPKSVQIAFKPHPLLMGKLYSHQDWGKVKTDAYYNQWDLLPNGQLETGEYIDLFLLSDALIHDSASFMTEYLVTNKPAAFTIRDEKIANRFNEFGKKVFELHYHIYKSSEILIFIQNVVLNSIDFKKNQREQFVLNNLNPLNGKSASENIIHEIITSIFKSK